MFVFLHFFPTKRYSLYYDTDSMIQYKYKNSSERIAGNGKIFFVKSSVAQEKVIS